MLLSKLLLAAVFVNHMFRVIFKKFKILYSIIISNTINMMRYFFGFKITTKWLTFPIPTRSPLFIIKKSLPVSIFMIAFLLTNVNSKLCFAEDIFPFSGYISLSLRTANIPEQPTDYEYKGGVKSKTTEMSGYKERENGIIYNGFDYSQSKKYFYSKIKYKEAQDIDSQSFAVTYPVNGWSFGAGLNAQRWNNGLPMVVMGYKNRIINISYELANKRQIINSKVSEQIPLNNNFYIEPLALYHYEVIDNNKKDYWQAKILIGYKFKIKKE